MLAAAGECGVGGVGAFGELEFVNLMAADGFRGGEDADGDAATVDHRAAAARVTSMPRGGLQAVRRSRCSAWVRAQSVATVGEDRRARSADHGAGDTGEPYGCIERKTAGLAGGAERGGKAVVDVGAVGHAGIVRGRAGASIGCGALVAAPLLAR